MSTPRKQYTDAELLQRYIAVKDQYERAGRTDCAEYRKVCNFISWHIDKRAQDEQKN